MAQHIFVGAGAPTSTPTDVAQHYIDTTNKVEYISVGTTSSADWKIRQAISSLVNSFNSRTGTVVPQAGDYNAAQVGADPSGTAAAAVAAHVALPDAHPGYLTTAEGNAAYDAIGSASTVQSNLTSHTGNNSNPHATTKAQVGLGNCDNTSDILKPISTATQTALNNKLNSSEVGVSVCELVGGFIPSGRIPGSIDDVLEFANLASFPITGVSGKLYLAIDTLLQYRWSGSVYSQIVSSPGTTDSVSEGSINLYFTNLRAANAAPVQSVNGLNGAVTLTKSSIGLSNVDNTSDVNKIVSTAQAAADTAVQNFAINRNNHTGTQLAATISDLASTILAQVLTGLSLADATDVTAADTILQAFGKFQAQHNEVRKIRTNANLTNNSNVTTTQITQLGFTCAAGKAYRFKTHILFSSTATNTGIGLTITSPDGAVGTLVSSAEMPLSNTDGTTSKYNGSMTALNDLVISTSVGLSNTFYLAEIEGTFVCTTAGTIAPYFRSETNGQTITVLSGSNNIIWEM